jgi:hypothetical protein
MEVEKPVLFSAPMVQAILHGCKFQTRRIVKGLPVEPDVIDEFLPADPSGFWGFDKTNRPLHCVHSPYGEPGTKLWVRETFAVCADNNVFYRADGKPDPWEGVKWKPSIFMPRAASRITLEVTKVRIERLHAISERDAQFEGVKRLESGPFEINGMPVHPHTSSYREAFAALWDKINGKKYPWSKNHWVWVVEFDVIKPNHFIIPRIGNLT